MNGNILQAALETLEEIRSQQTRFAAVTTPPEKSSFLQRAVASLPSFLGGRGTKAADLLDSSSVGPDDVSLTALVSELDAELAVAERDGSDRAQLRLHFTSRATVKLTSDLLPLVRLQVALVASIEAKATASVMSFHVTDFLLLDEFSRQPFSRRLIASRNPPIDNIKPLASSSQSFSERSAVAALQTQLSVIFQTKPNGDLSLRT